MSTHMNSLLSNISKTELFRMLVDNTPVAYIILDDEYRIHYINENFLKLRNLDLETTLGEICYNISNAGVRCHKCAVAKAIRTSQKSMVSRKDILPDKSVRFIDDYAIPLYKDEQTGKQFILEIMVNRTKEMTAREQRDSIFIEILSILLSLIDAKDTYTAAHSQSVHDVAMKIGASLRLSDKELFELSSAATLHDIGKVYVPNDIINKPGRLTDEEYEIIKKHPVLSDEMLQRFSSFDSIRDGVRYHHERYDGKGYPDGLAGDDIPLNAKIIAVADTYDAITSTRSYRKGQSHEAATAEICRVSGTQLDPKVVEAFLRIDFNSPDQNGTNHTEKPTIERILEAQCVIQYSPNDISKDDFVAAIDQERILEGIFDNTPCGYVLMDTTGTVLYASNYFYQFMGLTEENVVGRKCYQSNGLDKPCEHCSIMQSVQSKQVEYMRNVQNTKNGRKIFDMYGMPITGSSGETEYVIEVIIDRTDEILFEHQREVDYEELIQMLKDVWEGQSTKEGDMKLITQTQVLRKRMKELMHQAHI